MISELSGKSVLVVAHPDDENLWFSSILGDVDHVILCYMGELVNPPFGDLRKQALSEYPLRGKMSCLELVSLGASQPRNFQRPTYSHHGIEFTDSEGISEELQEQYKENFCVLREKLEKILAGYQTVVTHNPWGEYGHEEHVQVHRVVQELQSTMGYTILFSNYCSTRTIHLVPPFMTAATRVGTVPTDHNIARQLMEFYKKNDIWTWYEDWQWPAEEAFFKVTGRERDGTDAGCILPVNMIVMPPLAPRRRPRGSMRQRIVRRIIGSLGVNMRELV